MHLRFLAYCAAFVLTVSSVSAQSITAEMLLQGGGVTASQLEQLNQLQNGRANQSQTLQNPQILGEAPVQNLRGDQEDAPEILDPSDTINIVEEDDLPESLLGQYYMAVTGENLSLFGPGMLAIAENPNILFFDTIGRDYVLSVGDTVNISMRGLTSLDQDVTVDARGRIALPNFPVIVAKDRTIAELEEHLLDTVSVDDRSAQVFVTLGSARLLPVQITGAVVEPRTIAVPAYTPVSRVLSLIGDLDDQASVRNISIISGGEKVREIDMYDVYSGDPGDSEYFLTQATRIHVGTLAGTVAVSGLAGRPGIYELPAGRTSISSQELFQLANMTLIPPGAEVEVLRLDADGNVSSLTVDPLQGFQVQAGQAVRVSFVRTRNVKKIEVKGAVVQDFSLTSTSPVSVAKVLRDGAVLKPTAVVEFALIEARVKGVSVPRAVDLRHAFANPDAVVMHPGETLIVFDTQSYTDLIQIDLSGTADLRAKYLKQSGASEIVFDTTRVAFVAPNPVPTVMDAINSHMILPENTAVDFAVMYDPDDRSNSIRTFSIIQAQKSPRDFMLPAGWRIQLYSRGLLKDLADGRLSPKVLASNAVQLLEAADPAVIFLDGNLVANLPSGLRLSTAQVTERLRSAGDVYPLYASVQTRQSGTLFFNHAARRVDDLIGVSSDFTVRSGQRIDLYTTSFIRRIFEDVDEDSQAVVDLASANVDELVNQQIVDDFTNQDQNPELQRVQPTQSEENRTRALNGLVSSAKLLTGAVEQPGFYPVAQVVTLAELLSVANGTLPNADTARVTVRRYHTNSAGSLHLKSSKKIDISRVAAHQVVLRGDFDVFVPSYINDASVGRITLDGEVNRPGEYTFGRNETLHDIIQRAGGLTPVAYPLGAVFTREPLKKEQRAANQSLARQVEQSILTLSQSDRDGAGDQISAVLTFAKQLRSLPVSGRQSVNIALRTSGNPIYLQDGDLLFVPKRPSHVSVIGSVYSQVSTDFNPRKTVADYLSDAGGLDRVADNRNIYLVLPNGQSQPLANDTDTTTLVPPGAVIVVPPKTDKLTALGLTEVISKILGNIATSLLAINAVR